MAQEAVTLSISPTLYDMSAEPGQVWNSTLKVVNVNQFDLTVYAEVVNFAPRGEGGDGRFIPINDQDRTGATMAEWFTISREPIVIPREQTIEVPFTVTVPKEASPGGHFAAILIGTKPLEREDGQAKLQTAQVITSLFFARIAGDITELGTIREFSTTKSVFGSPEATFALRFENKGNVHLQPQGEIKILNMWGEERGIIPINQFSNFGNVLPDSIRKFLFTWKGEWSIADIGRYTAIATLAYGANERQFATAETAFWVLPLQLLFWLLVGLGLFFVAMTWLIRLYVRHMLVMAGVKIEEYEAVQRRTQPVRVGMHAPVRAGILDLSQRLQRHTSLRDRAATLIAFIVQYRLFFLGLLLMSGFVSALWWYLVNANTAHRPYEVTYLQSESVASTQLTSEEILYEQLRQSRGEQVSSPREGMPKIAIVNRSGIAGLGASTRLRLEEIGYEVISLDADFQAPQTRTVIVADGDAYELAMPVSRILGNAPVSVRQNPDGVAALSIFVGEDIQNLSP